MRRAQSGYLRVRLGRRYYDIITTLLCSAQMLATRCSKRRTRSGGKNGKKNDNDNDNEIDRRRVLYR